MIISLCHLKGTACGIMPTFDGYITEKLMSLCGKPCSNHGVWWLLQVTKTKYYSAMSCLVKTLKSKCDYSCFMLGKKLRPHCSSPIALTLTNSSQRKHRTWICFRLDFIFCHWLPEFWKFRWHIIFCFTAQNFNGTISDKQLLYI